MRKIISFIVVAAALATSVLIWTKATASGPQRTEQASQARGFTPDAMHRGPTFSDTKFHDMSFVYSQEQ